MQYRLVKMPPEVSVEHTIERVTEALDRAGIRMIAKIDVRDLLKKFRRCLILGTCSGPTSLPLPCNIIVQEDPAKRVTVSIGDPRGMIDLVEHADVDSLMQIEETEKRLRRVLDGCVRYEREDQSRFLSGWSP